MSTIAVLVYLSSLAIVTLAQCPQGWQQSSLGNQKCYLVVKDVNMFDQADTFCTRAAQDGHLTSISSKFENDFISGWFFIEFAHALCRKQAFQIWFVVRGYPQIIG
jgi:hypothetical protein